MKILGWVVVGFIGFSVLWGLGLVVGIVSLPFHAVSNIVDTEHGVIDRTINADNAIYNYEWFKSQVEAIKAQERKIIIANESIISFEASAGQRTTWTFEDKIEDARLKSVVQGNKSQLEDMIAVYNARSKMATRNIFQDGLIPDSFEIGSNLLTGINLK